MFEAPGKAFEDFVGKALKRKYRQKDGWQVIPQSLLPSHGPNLKVDFLIQNERRNRKIIAEAKAKKAVSTADLRQLEDYKKRAKADEAILYITRKTHVPDSIKKELASKRGMKIQPTRFPAKSFL